jgi:hypothetical protein
MATATAVTAGVQGAVGIAGGVSKFFEGKKMQRRAQKLIDSFEFSKLQNVQENREVSTRGADVALEEANIMAASSVDALKSGGSRAVLGGLGRVQANKNSVAQGVGANLDAQEKDIQAAVANDNGILRGMKENRETNEIAGYGQMLNVGMGMKYGGIADSVNALGAASETLSGLEGATTPKPKPTPTTA